jgi:hypothetical protein
MQHSAELKTKFYLRLRAMPLNREIQVKNFLVNSALYGTAGSRLRAMPIGESIFVVEFNRIFPRIRIYMQNRCIR